MTYRLRVDVEAGGRLRLIARDASGNAVPLNAGDQVKSLNQFNWSITVGVEASFEIVNYHFSDQYEVTTTNGSVRVVGNEVRYTPSEPGVGGFTLNGTKHALTVLKNQPFKPVLTSPSQGGEVVSVYPILTSSSYLSDDETVTHAATRWQISTDPFFNELVMDVESEAELLAKASIELRRGVTYYARVKHIGTKP